MSFDPETKLWIEDALAHPAGARFHKCALQVNPFEYVGRHDHPTQYKTEKDYNDALITALRKAEVAAIAITDHFRVESGRALADAARGAGIVVFPGFEANTKDGIHFLCLFDPSTPIETVQARIHECRLKELHAESPRSELDCDELLERQRRCGMLVIAPHVTSARGLLVAIANGERRAEVWKHSELHACSIAGKPEDLPSQHKAILCNEDPQYFRERPMAILNVQDIKDPSDVSKPGSVTEIKMSEVTLEGLRQAFIDPETRVRRADQIPEKPHTEILALRWESGGFLGNARLRLNSNLNVLVGGRGTGKSTVIESIRYAANLRPLTTEAQKAHEGIVRRVLGEATRISVLVRVHAPASREYVIERIVPNPPEVKDIDGNLMRLQPSDLLRGMELYGQHEIAELCGDREKLTGLLRRFTPDEAPLQARKVELLFKLEKSRHRLLQVKKELNQLNERLLALPGLEEALKRYAESGLQERLKDQAKLIAEERVLRTAQERVTPIEQLAEELQQASDIDIAFLSDKALQELPAGQRLLPLGNALKQLGKRARDAAIILLKEADATRTTIKEIEQEWSKEKAIRQAAYERILRDLQKSAPGVDTSEFGKLHKRIGELYPLRDRLKRLEAEYQSLQTERAKFVSEWEQLKAEHFRLLDQAAKRLSRAVEWRVRVTVEPGGSKEPLRKLCAESLEGATKPICDRLLATTKFSLPQLVAASRSGAAALKGQFNLTQAQSDRLVQGGEEFFLRLEELDFPFETKLELNLGEGGVSDWRELEQLSKGQKATAVLLLLLLESDVPLIVDQPEDDLDNRFIMDGVVPKIRTEKQRRQFVFATHNANIPVLGDAELIAVLEAQGEPGSGTTAHAGFVEKAIGSIDNDTVRTAIGDILEGGKAAFETRRVKYGY